MSYLLRLLLVTLLAPESALAATPCRFLSVPCESRSGSDVVSGAAFPSFADTFNVNPAAIPTIPTPIGFELIATRSGGVNKKKTYDFAFIKGYQNIGAAASTNSDNTFYSYNLLQAHQAADFGDITADPEMIKETAASTINMGAAAAVVLDRLKNAFVPSLGLNTRFNKMTKRLDPGAGISLNANYLVLGASISRSSGVSALSVPDTYTSTLSLGTKISRLSLDYTRITYSTNNTEIRERYQLFKKPIQIFTASLNIGFFSGVVGYRRALDIFGVEKSLVMMVLQFQLGGHLSLALLNNYVPGTFSAGMQVFL